MSKFDELRPVVWEEMGALEQLGLGFREHVSAGRDKFVLSATHARATALTDKVEADGFVRADDKSLLFRHASQELRERIPSQIAARAMESDKGLEFRWSQLGPADLRTVFTVVRALALPAA